MTPILLIASLFVVEAPPVGAPVETVRAVPPDDRGTATAVEDAPPVAVDGLYPIWEQTGALEARGSARIGYGHADVGLGPISIATQPFLDLYGTANASAKVGLYQGPRLKLALVAGAYRIPSAAQDHTIGSLNASTFANPLAPVWMMPVSVAMTALVTPRLHLHASASVVDVASSEPSYRSLSGGVAAFAEWFATTHLSARVHVGSEGWGTWPQTHAGLSFAWQSRHVALQAGYARRFDPGETSDGVFMWDAGLVFP